MFFYLFNNTCIYSFRISLVCMMYFDHANPPISFPPTQNLLSFHDTASASVLFSASASASALASVSIPQSLITAVQACVYMTMKLSIREWETYQWPDSVL